ncbi:glycosyltransferase family 4 protein [Portibacter marinus]|uniref:glycosyltransferase family 4 protein n=1 Tax=Portibacter marinus TaxID=2898660 RepID=UPI001F16B40B|nr:glycosyltransferase family 4 protein [Portibacter marinus]
MKILFLTDNFPPEVNAPASRTYEHCKEWVKLGVEVTVITCAPNFPMGKLYNGYKNKAIQKETMDGIEVIRVWSYIAPNSGFLKRILDFASYAIMSFIVGLFVRCDVIIGTSPQFFTAISARCLAFFKLKKWIFEVRDIWPESIVAVGSMKRSSKLFKFLHWIEKKLYRSASLIIPVTDSFKEYISKFTNTSKIHVVKNGVDHELFKPIPKNKQLLHHLGLQGKFIVGYIGTLGMAHALEFIVESINDPNLSDKFHFIFLGDGSEKLKLIKRSKELKLSNTSFLPFVSKESIPDYISLLDVALVNLRKDDTFKSVIPSKIFENAAMQKPILLGVSGESKKIIEKYNAGLCFEPENKADFIHTLDKMLNPHIYKDLVIGCQKLSSDYSRKRLAATMLNHISHLNE